MGVKHLWSEVLAAHLRVLRAGAVLEFIEGKTIAIDFSITINKASNVKKGVRFFRPAGPRVEGTRWGAREWGTWVGWGGAGRRARLNPPVGCSHTHILCTQQSFLFPTFN